MARSLTVSTATKAATRLATEPLVIIEIQWSSGTKHYADKTLTLGSITAQGQILEFAPVNASGKQDTRGDISSASVLLDDIDGLLKVIVNTLIIEGVTVTVFHHYEGNLQADLVVMLKGTIAGNIQWDEGARTLGFDVETIIEDVEVGFAATEALIPGINPDAIDVTWPLVFGTVLRIPGVPVFKSPFGRNTDKIFGGYAPIEVDPFEIDNGEDFPQSTLLTLSVGWTLFTGSFNGKIFSRTVSNLTWFINLSVAARPIGDNDESNRRVCFIAPGIDIAHKYCWLGPNKQFNYCLSQEGVKCFFQFDWDNLIGAGDTFVEVRGSPHSTWYFGGHVLNFWFVKESQPAFIFNQTQSDFYVVNLFPSAQILEVLGTRTFNDEEIIAPIPSSYYIKHLSLLVAGQNATVIEMIEPLESIPSEGWKGDVFVSLRSTLNSNVSDIIKGTFELLTSFSIDAASFLSVRSDVNPYPANFALFDRPDILKFVEDVAWQARCAVYIRNGIVSIKYLSKEPVPDYTITETDVLLKTIQLGFIPTEEIYTKLEATWFSDYSGERLSEHRLDYRNNVDIFGLRSIDREFFIYNIEELVRISANFWGYRYSNSWRILELDTFLRTLTLEVYDAIANSIPIVSSFTIKGVLEAVSHDSADQQIALKAMLASKAGDSSFGEPIEDPGFWNGDPAFPVTALPLTDPGVGLTETTYIVPVTPLDKGENEAGEVAEVEEFFFKFISPIFVEIERGVDFTITIELQNSDGLKVDQTVNAILSLHSDDSLDVFDMNNSIEFPITLINGSFELTTAEIINGSLSIFGFLSVVDSQNRPNYEPDTTIIFKIINLKVAVLVWDTEPPASVNRGDNFAVAISGGTGGVPENINILSNLTDPADILFDATTNLPISVVQLNAGGTFAATWYFSGGEGDDVGNVLTINDSENEKYADVPTAAFNIDGATIFIRKLTQEIVIVDRVGVNENKLTLVFVSGEFNDNTIFKLKVEFRDSNGALINFDDIVNLSIKDSLNQDIQWLLPDSGTVITVPLVGGEALGPAVDCSVQLPPFNIPTATISANITFQGELFEATLPGLTWILVQSLVQTLVIEDSVVKLKEIVRSLSQELIIEDTQFSGLFQIFEESLVQLLEVVDKLTVDFTDVSVIQVAQTLEILDQVQVVFNNVSQLNLAQNLIIEDQVAVEFTNTHNISLEQTLVIQDLLSVIHQNTTETLITQQAEVAHIITHTLNDTFVASLVQTLEVLDIVAVQVDKITELSLEQTLVLVDVVQVIHNDQIPVEIFQTLGIEDVVNVVHSNVTAVSLLQNLVIEDKLQITFNDITALSVVQNLVIEDVLAVIHDNLTEVQLSQDLVIEDTVVVDLDNVTTPSLSQDLVIEDVVDVIKIGTIFTSIKHEASVDHVITAVNLTQKLTDELIIEDSAIEPFHIGLSQDLIIEDAVDGRTILNAGLYHWILKSVPDMAADNFIELCVQDGITNFGLNFWIDSDPWQNSPTQEFHNEVFIDGVLDSSATDFAGQFSRTGTLANGSVRRAAQRFNITNGGILTAITVSTRPPTGLGMENVVMEVRSGGAIDGGVLVAIQTGATINAFGDFTFNNFSG